MVNNIIDVYLKEFTFNSKNDLIKQKNKALHWARINGYLNYHLEPQITVIDFGTKQCYYTLIIRDLSQKGD